MIFLQINNLTFGFDLYNEQEEKEKFDNARDELIKWPDARKTCKYSRVIRTKQDEDADNDEKLIFGLREEENCGLTYRSQLKVFINDNLPRDLILTTLDHEIHHCYLWAYGLNQFGPFNEEQLCDIHAAHAREEIKDADKVYKYLLKELDKREDE